MNGGPPSRPFVGRIRSMGPSGVHELSLDEARAVGALPVRDVLYAGGVGHFERSFRDGMSLSRFEVPAEVDGHWLAGRFHPTSRMTVQVVAGWAAVVRWSERLQRYHWTQLQPFASLTVEPKEEHAIFLSSASVVLVTRFGPPTDEPWVSCQEIDARVLGLTGAMVAASCLDEKSPAP